MCETVGRVRSCSSATLVLGPGQCTCANGIAIATLSSATNPLAPELTNINANVLLLPSVDFSAQASAMTMTMTHSEKVNQHQSAAWPCRHEWRDHNLAKKESVEAVVPCALGKVCNWDTVDDSVQSHKKRIEGNTGYCWDKLNEFGRPVGIRRFQKSTSLWTEGRKSVAGVSAHRSSLRGNLARDTLSQPKSFIGVCGPPLTILH